MKHVKRIRAFGLVWMLALGVAGNPAAALAEESTGAAAGLGFASAFTSLLYAPTKVVYAVLGTVFGGLAWGLSGGDRDVLDAVIIPAVRGDYVVTPAHLRGQKDLEFFGRRPGYEVASETADIDGW